MRRVTLVVLLGLLLGLLAACGGGGTAPAKSAAASAEAPVEESAAASVAASAEASVEASAAASTEASVEASAAASTEASAAASTAASAAASTEASAAASTAGGALPDLAGREVRIAVENAYPPFNYINPQTNEGEGWDYEAWNEICSLLNCSPVYEEASWEGMIQAVGNGQYDAGADGITITPERAEQVDFSDGYIQVDQRLLARAGEDRFAGMDEFVANAELRMGTQTGTTNYETAKELLPEDRLQAFEQFPFAVAALINGDVDAVIMDETAGRAMSATAPNSSCWSAIRSRATSLALSSPKGASWSIR